MNDPTGKTYIGFAYNKTTSTESNTPTDYTWSLIKGDKGDTGVKGDRGEKGETYYTWIKYSDNADGTGLYDTPKDTTMYIGIAINKTTPTESANKTDYTWSKFKGDKGDKGQQGEQGIQGGKGDPGDPGEKGQSLINSTPQWYKSTSSTTQTGGEWTATMPTAEKGYWYWLRFKLDFENPTETKYTTPTLEQVYTKTSNLEQSLDGFKTTVSNTYADEIKTPFYGEGLDGLLRARSNSLRGIVNGIDYNDFNPETDINLSARYNATTFRKEKVKNKIQLQKDLGLEQDPKAMMIGIVSRLTDQKGFDLIAYIMDELCQDSVQIVALGTGDERYENMFRHFDWKYHGKVSAQIYYDESMSHRIYAASDAFLMPSLFEPCGLSQLMSLRYGTLPIVRETGGLKDTVEPYNEFEGTGTGFSFSNYNAHEMLSTIRYAEHIYYDKKREWNKMVDRAMAKDFSWSNSARQYEEMYNWLIGE